MMEFDLPPVAKKVLPPMTIPLNIYLDSSIRDVDVNVPLFISNNKHVSAGLELGTTTYLTVTLD